MSILEEKLEEKQDLESAELVIPHVPETKRRPYPTIGQAVVLVVLAILLQLCCGMLVRLASSFPGFAFAEGIKILVTNVMALGFALLLALRRANRPVRAVLPLQAVPPALWVPMVCTVLGCSILISEASNLMISVWPPPEVLKQLFDRLQGEPLLVRFLLLVIVAPLTEEPLMRGAILGGFLRNYSVPKAVFASALIFAVFHLNPWQFFGALALGALFAWWRVYTGSLWPGVCGHALNNGMGIIVIDLLNLHIPGYTPGDEAVAFQPAWFTALGGVLCVAGILLTRKVFKEYRPTHTLCEGIS